jgi:hypothetical protein
MTVGVAWHKDKRVVWLRPWIFQLLMRTARLYFFMEAAICADATLAVEELMSMPCSALLKQDYGFGTA